LEEIKEFRGKNEITQFILQFFFYNSLSRKLKVQLHYIYKIIKEIYIFFAICVSHGIKKNYMKTNLINNISYWAKKSFPKKKSDFIKTIKK
jgi:hypothetical protein